MLKSLLALVLLGAFATPAQGQAYCALRDPNKQIYTLFDEANSYRSIVRTIDEGSRADIAERLPFTLHFSELGRHTIYVAMRDGEALGIVHVRSEIGKWGLVEVAWALDVNLRVVDFGFQRCRDGSKSAFEAPQMRARFIGAGFDELRAMIDRSGTELVPEALPLPAEAQSLGLALVRNGLKMMAATESAWGADVRLLKAQEIARRLTPGALVTSVTRRLYGPGVVAVLDREVGQGGTSLDRDRAHAFDLTTEEGEVAGQLLTAPWKQGPLGVRLWWVLDSKGRLIAVEPSESWPRMDLRELFQAQVGKQRQDFEGCIGAVELSTLEAMIILQGLTPP